MIEELKKLQEKLEQNTEWEITISQELYDLLVAECNQTQGLLKLIDSQREKSTARVLSNKEIISEQVDEIEVPELWLTQHEINEYRAYRKVKCSINEYEWDLEERGLKEIDKKVLPFLRWDPEQTFYLDFLLNKAKGSVAVYDIIEDAYVSEFLKSMDCYSEEDINQTFGGMAMNLMQIDWLYKQNHLDYNETYVAFLKKNGQILPYNVWSSRRKKPSSWGPITNLNKKRKMLLFYPKDLIDKE